MNAIPDSRIYVPLRTVARAPGRPAFLCLLAGFLLGAAALAAPQGELDVSFGDNGRLIIAEIDRHAGAALAQQVSDGKLIIAGDASSATGGDKDLAVTRLNPDGTPDLSFGNSGTVVVDLGGSDHAIGIAIQPDGKIIIAGSSYINEPGYGFAIGDFALARLNADGSLDTSFDEDGVATVDIGGGYEEIRGVTLLPDGRIMVTGVTDVDGISNTVFARFNTDGTLDTTFGTGAIAGTTVVDTGGTNNEPLEVTLQADGKAIACGFVDTDYWDNPGTMYAVRIHADGSLDSGFATGGIARIETFSWANTCVSMPDGTLVLGGSKNRVMAFARLTADGDRDATFGGTGFLTMNPGGNATVNAITIIDGRDVAVTGRLVGSFADGYGNQVSMPDDMFVARLDLETGQFDPDFGNAGITQIDFGTANLMASSDGRNILQQVDGKLVVLGGAGNIPAGSSSATALARIDPYGSGSPGWLGFVMTSAMFSENAGRIGVGVRRTGGSTGSVSVDYRTLAGTATSIDDFTDSSGTLTWLDGEVDMKFVEIPLTNDTIEEVMEALTIELSNATGGLAASEFRVTILDDDAAPPPPVDPPARSQGGGGKAGAGFLLALFTIALFRHVPPFRRKPVRRPANGGA